jgi:hypothetical protein
MSTVQCMVSTVYGEARKKPEIRATPFPLHPLALTHSPTHPLTHAPTHPPTYSLAHLTHSSTHALTHSPATHSPTYYYPTPSLTDLLLPQLRSKLRCRRILQCLLKGLVLDPLEANAFESVEEFARLNGSVMRSRIRNKVNGAGGLGGGSVGGGIVGGGSLGEEESREIDAAAAGGAAAAAGGGAGGAGGAAGAGVAAGAAAALDVEACVVRLLSRLERRRKRQVLI